MVNVALVTLGKDLHADLEDLQWGLNSYMLAFAALIVAAGRVADVFGRRRCLLAGAIVFAMASLLCGIAPTLSVLVIGRVLQGAGGALMLPAGMAIISSVYNAEERAVALGTLVGIAGVAQSIGPLVGGFLTAQVSWRLVFWINLPLIAVIMIIALRAIQESRDENASHRIDIKGVVVLGLFAGVIWLQRVDCGNRPGSVQSCSCRNWSHVRTPNEPLSTADTANRNLHVDDAGTGDPVICPGIVRIQWNGDSFSPDCRRGRARIYIAKHRWSHRGFAGTLRSGNGNDLHVSIRRRCDWHRCRERTSRCLFPAPSRFQII